MKKLVPLFAALAASLAGCASTPEETATAQEAVVTVVQRVYGAFQTCSASSEEPVADSGRVAGTSSGTAGSSVSSATDASPAPVLDYRYGGFKGGNAKEDPRCRLSSPTITADTIRYKWETKAPADWARNKTESGNLVVAAAFFWDESAKKWVGGKFEWTDESRSSRSCQNIYEGYGGWDAAAWKAAKKRAFCVVSADGKYRSNLLEDQP